MSAERLRVAARCMAGAAVLLVLMALGSGCAADRGEWRAELVAAGAERLVGLWRLDLRLDRRGGDTLPVRVVSGDIALTLNEGRLSGSGSDTPPMFFGTYDVAFESLGVSAGAQGGVPSVVARLRGRDTLDLTLAPEPQQRVELHGIALGDSVVGRWRAYQPRGIDAAGDFVLRRP